MSTPDTSSDDATLAADDLAMAELWLRAMGEPTTRYPRWRAHLEDVVAIARRLQGENAELHARLDATYEAARHWENRADVAEMAISGLQAEVRELRATIARLQPTADLYTVRKNRQ